MKGINTKRLNEITRALRFPEGYRTQFISIVRHSNGSYVVLYDCHTHPFGRIEHRVAGFSFDRLGGRLVKEFDMMVGVTRKDKRDASDKT